jgi:phosphoribosylaminoimidazole-succinocarboxamide synthase
MARPVDGDHGPVENGPVENGPAGYGSFYDGPAILDEIDLPLPDRQIGKVRRSWQWPTTNGSSARLFCTTDRLSAFDRVLACVPHKGQVLNQLAAWWFDETRDVVANHVIGVPDPNLLIAVAAQPLSVEVIVRGYITGVTSTSLWTRYHAGQRYIDGHHLPDGLQQHDQLPHAVITPTTKATNGAHDSPLSERDVVDQGLVAEPLWNQVHDVALELFARGQQRAAAAGLMLADTKYEFGLDEHGALMAIDEMHTPDSSRYWDAATYSERRSGGLDPESFDKEPVRRAFAELGYRGDGPMPLVDTTVWSMASSRYVECFERLTGTAFVPGAQPIAPRITSWCHDQLATIKEGHRAST